MTADRWQELADANESTAAELTRRGPGVSEIHDLEPAMRAALDAAGWRLEADNRRVALRGWCHKLGGFDVATIDDTERVVGEQKLWKTDEVLWDLFKLADALRDQADLAFLQVGVPATVAPEACSELFADGPIRHGSLSLFRGNQRAWSTLLQGGTARPIELPCAVTTEVVGDAPVVLGRRTGRLVVIRVEPDWSSTVRFDAEWWAGDWPEGVDPPPAYREWRRRHCELLRHLTEAGPVARADHAWLERDNGLNHACRRLITSGKTADITDEGRRFLERWGPSFQ